MPAFNSEEFISESIESILNSNFLNYELVIVDDGSTDGTASIIKKYISKLDNLIYLKKSNSGIVDSLNYGLKFCKGKWIARLDSDDLLTPNRLSRQSYFAEKNKDIGLIGSNYTRIDKFGNELFNYNLPTSNKKLIRNLVNCKRFFPHSSAFFEKELVNFLGGYRTRVKHSEDWDLWIRISEYKRVISINESLVKIRDHENQITKNKFGKNQIYDARVALICHWYRLNKDFDPIEKLDDKNFKIFKNYIYESLDKYNIIGYLKISNTNMSPLKKRIFLTFKLLIYLLRPLDLYNFFLIIFFSKRINMNIARDSFDKYLSNNVYE